MRNFGARQSPAAAGGMTPEGGRRMTEASAPYAKETYKLYVEAGVVYTPDGEMIPQYVRLEKNGKMFLVDKVYRHERMASRKAGGCGICYFVRINGQDAMLFYEDAPQANRWFVETKRPIPVTDGTA